MRRGREIGARDRVRTGDAQPGIPKHRQVRDLGMLSRIDADVAHRRDTAVLDRRTGNAGGDSLDPGAAIRPFRRLLARERR